MRHDHYGPFSLLNIWMLGNLILIWSNGNLQSTVLSTNPQSPSWSVIWTRKCNDKSRLQYFCRLCDKLRDFFLFIINQVLILTDLFTIVSLVDRIFFCSRRFFFFLNCVYVESAHFFYFGFLVNWYLCGFQTEKVNLAFKTHSYSNFNLLVNLIFFFNKS